MITSSNWKMKFKMSIYWHIFSKLKGNLFCLPNVHVFLWLMSRLRRWHTFNNVLGGFCVFCEAFNYVQPKNIFNVLKAKEIEIRSCFALYSWVWINPFIDFIILIYWTESKQATKLMSRWSQASQYGQHILLWK